MIGERIGEAVEAEYRYNSILLSVRKVQNIPCCIVSIMLKYSFCVIHMTHIALLGPR